MSLPGHFVEHRPAAILPLPADAIAQIRSSAAITSFDSVVFGLLANSLDAQATKIEITIDCRRGGCRIEDNGLGIPPAEFREDGGLGRMYHTSKCNGTASSPVHGSTGTFLASLAALSVVTITSRHHLHYSHNTLTLHRAKPIVRLTPAPSQHHIHNYSHGSRVVVRDLFGNMPVRVKQRAMAADEPLEVEKNWQALKKGIVSMLLPWASAVSVKVSDINERSRNFAIACNASSADDSLCHGRINIEEQKMLCFDAEKTVSILAQAGYAAWGLKDSWVPASASTPSVSVGGLISLEPAPSKSTQFISIGITPCTDDTGHHDLYDAINHAFSQSSFGHVEEDPEPGPVELERRKYDRRFKNDGPTNKQRRGSGIGVDRWPRFCLHVNIKEDGSTSNTNRNTNTNIDKRLKDTIDVLEALVTQWLESNHFGPRKRKRKRLPNQDDSEYLSGDPLSVSSSALSSIQSTMIDNQKGRQPRSAMSARTLLGSDDSRSPTPFTEWSRIKTGKATSYDEIWKCNSPLARQIQGDDLPAKIEVQSLRAGELDRGTRTPRLSNQKLVHEEVQDQSSGGLTQASSPANMVGKDFINWVNPATNQRSRIDVRTGMVLPEATNMSSDGMPACQQPAVINTKLSAFGRPKTLGRRHATSEDAAMSKDAAPSHWIAGLLKDRNSSVFANQVEQAIPVANLDGPGHEVGEAKHRCKDHTISQTFLQPGYESTSRLSRDALLHAQIISQVDQKFILLKMSSTPKVEGKRSDNARQLLVMVDQHAASERCILEDLLAELCHPNKNGQSFKSSLGHESCINTTKLEKALHCQVSQEEALMFRAHGSIFARWGVLYNINETKSRHDGSKDSKLIVLTLPPGIAERCKAEPKHLIGLLRSEVHALAQSPSSTGHVVEPTTSPSEPYSWLRQIGSCPKGIINMLNSRACRSAIMFNDKLSVMECRELIRKLATCAFPFMCAHGRVSMVPMIHLDGHGVERGHVGSSVFEEDTSSEDGQGFARCFKQWRAKGQNG
ncbi:hypothetical protein BDV97DRAFT_330482 [Delphinella strobiligena]|nr:hypothetical protein BDV97DRAFT_330482 [Delphinella strobiligena]